MGEREKRGRARANVCEGKKRQRDTRKRQRREIQRASEREMKLYQMFHGCPS